ncbi:glycerophosphocholine phosphodiesterase Gde1 [Ascobolus immersus RN42]|uniref:Glycerophosphocholine phosphodiesterase Gde1 n=1 Tax=Ascobolus immersus RN42 TaxID=1160509 RepID=A0A3N4II22_ASCIM|nr:glycerophosphocholine phosphodiesterase Gde1 [Ascobolus immersus RN42]
MKFGKNLPREQVKEWSSSYIDYSTLKKELKTAVERKDPAAPEPDLAEFFFSLDRDLETVDSFYNKRLAEFERRYRLVDSRYSLHPPQFDKDEIRELFTALLDLRNGLRNLKKYAEVNKQGFTKILKKADKKTGSNVKERYLATKVLDKPFATLTELLDLITQVNEWLSKLDDDNSIRDYDNSQGNALQRVTSPGARAYGNLDKELVAKVDSALGIDDADALKAVLSSIEAGGSFTQKLALILLQKAISGKRFECLGYLLGKVQTLTEEDDINERNVVHRLVIYIGRNRPSAKKEAGLNYGQVHGLRSRNLRLDVFVSPSEAPDAGAPLNDTEDAEEHIGLDLEDSAKVLGYLLDHLQPNQQEALIARDSYGRFPLHYAAEFGLLSITQLLVDYMQKFGQYDVSSGIDSEVWHDADGLAPLDLAIIRKHFKTTRFLLSTANAELVDGKAGVFRDSPALFVAVRSDAADIVKLLLEAGFNVNKQNQHKETALHHAARLGHLDCMRALIEGTPSQKADVEIAESVYGWTPLFAAAVEGKEESVDLLISLGKADVKRFDYSGWTAKEHAMLRGHIEIARKINSYVPSGNFADTAINSRAGSEAVTPAAVAASTSSSPGTDASGSGGYFNRTFPSQLSKAIASVEPIKSFGHRYLKDKTMVLVTLGSKDIRKDLPAIKIDQIPMSRAHSTMLDSQLSLVVWAQNATGERNIIDLPIQGNMASDPIAFEADDITKVKLIFDVVSETHNATPDKIVGRAAAILDTVKTQMSLSKHSLHGNVQVPIFAIGNLDIIGCINFEFLIITPFHHPGIGITQEGTYWKELTGPKVIGHRGLGKNLPGRKSLQLGENTLQSFIAAANLGASYIEFDVQLTKDHVPVIYHDFLVGETGIDAPVHSLTLNQFLHMSEQRNSEHNHRDGHGKIRGANDSPNGNGTDEPPKQIRRTKSMSIRSAQQIDKLNERMKHTRDFRIKGYKGNSRGSTIQGPFATLEDVFRTIDAATGFNIELKYPMLQESEQEEMDSFAIEMNSWVDAVLKVVYDNAKNRDIIFSSFNPDICLLLSFKQPSIPILFLTEGGTEPMADIRCTSLQEAIRFASRWNLLGIVSAAEPFVLCPRLIRVVKESGLVCITYGQMNNEPANVRLQVNQGVDAVIVDNVLEIRKGLTQDEKASEDLAEKAVAGQKLMVPGSVAVNGRNGSVEENLKKWDGFNEGIEEAKEKEMEGDFRDIVVNK